MMFEQSILTSPFTGKSLQFLSESTLITPTGNRLMQYNLHNNTVQCIFQARFNIKYFSISGNHIAVVDDQHNLIADGIHISGKNKTIKDIKHSPDGKMIAIARQDKLTILDLEMHKIKTHQNKHPIQGMSWSPDSRFILTWGSDNTIIMNAVFPLKLYIDSILSAHKFKIVTAFFIQQKYVVSIDILGKVCLWKWVDDYLTDEFKRYQAYIKKKHNRQIGLSNETHEEYTPEEAKYMSPFELNAHKGRFILEKKLNIKEQLVKNINVIKSANFHHNNLLSIGSKNGVINLFRFELADASFLQSIQNFQITSASIDSVSLNTNANWIALGMRQNGQLIVWEWRSQSYILNQQSLSYETTSAAFSSDLTTIAIGTLGGIVRLYDYTSNFCVAKFDDQHTTKVTALRFCPSKQGVLVSASLDGTVRAYDTVRLRCFRVMVPEIPNQLHCLEIEPSGELICAGGFDPYEIYVFSLQTGQLVEVIAGHQSPVNCLKFTQIEESVVLVSGSWDKTIRLHDLYARGKKEGMGGESMLHNSEVTCLAVYENQAAVGTMGGEMVVWELKDAQILYTFDVHRDIQGGRQVGDSMGAQKNQNYKHFQTIQFSKEGSYLIGGGNSKFVCVYDTKYRVLLRKLVISNNLSLDGMKLKINFSRIDQETKNIEYSEDENQENLPGAKSFDVTKRSTKRVAVQVHHIEFSESNRQMIIAHCEGVSILTNENRRQYFDPLDMDESVTVAEIERAMGDQEYAGALLLSLKMNVQPILQSVFNHIPAERINQVVPAIPDSFVPRLLETITRSLQSERSVEKNLLWANQILIQFSHLIKGPFASKKVVSSLQELSKQVKIDFNRVHEPIRKCINLLEYLGSL